MIGFDSRFLTVYLSLSQAYFLSTIVAPQVTYELIETFALKTSFYSVEDGAGCVSDCGSSDSDSVVAGSVWVSSECI